MTNMRRGNVYMKKFISVVFTTLGVALMVIIFASVGVLVGWITGHIISWICGDFVARGINVLFDTTRFTKDMLPLIGGALGFIGGFFKSASTQ